MSKTNDSFSLTFRLNLSKHCSDATAYDEQISDLQSVLEQLGDWPLMNRYWDEDDFDWIKLTLRAKQQGLKYEPFLSFNVLPDQNMTKKVKYLTVSLAFYFLVHSNVKKL